MIGSHTFVPSGTSNPAQVPGPQRAQPAQPNLPRNMRAFQRIWQLVPATRRSPLQCACTASQHPPSQLDPTPEPTLDAQAPDTSSTGLPVSSSRPTSSDVREVIRITGQLDTVLDTRSNNLQQRRHNRHTHTHVAHMASSAQPASASLQGPGAVHETTLPVEAPRAAVLPSAAPVVRPMTEAQLLQLVEALESARRVVAITGAGCSTEAGIPDYRGPQGAYTKHGFKPMTHQQFMAGPAQRARYFARSFFGWHEFASSQPGGAHEGLARLVHNGWVSHIITQNVDRLHHKAGTPRDKVLELHGTTHEVRCLGCGAYTSRHDMQHRLAELNPAAADMAAQLVQQAAAAAAAQQQQRQVQQDSQSGRLDEPDTPQAGVGLTRLSAQSPVTPAQLIPVRRPDGDVELQDAGQGFIVPPCTQCGGTLMPDVVFFGDNIPPARVKQSLDLAGSADLLLVVGSSLMVYSAYRLVEACKRNGGSVLLVNVGATRADGVSDLKLEVLAGEAMMRAATHPRLLLPRVVH